METGGLEQKLIDDIVAVVLNVKNPDKIILYGSRANGTYHRESDIDLVIMASEWKDNEIALVHDRLEQGIKTPLKFDVAHWESITKESLKEDILREGIELYDAQKC